MKRIHVFEFEDFPWFPHWIRTLMTRYIVAIHKMLGSSKDLAGLIAKALPHVKQPRVIDLCSGGGGPMEDVAHLLKTQYGVKDLTVTLSDLYPNLKAAAAINNDNDPSISYLTTPVDATSLDADQKGVRTMVCSMHHMKPEVAKAILKDAKDAHQPICIFEISDNSFPPTWLWWVGLPLNFLSVLFVTPSVRPMTWQQIVFTYLIPILPLFIAWDGGVSNARTYTLSDWDELLSGLHADNYRWEKGTIKAKVGNKMYLMGLPE